MNDQRDLTVVLKSRFPLVVVEPDAFDVPALAAASEGFAGAEFRAWAAGRTVPAA